MDSWDEWMDGDNLKMTDTREGTSMQVSCFVCSLRNLVGCCEISEARLDAPLA